MLRKLRESSCTKMDHIRFPCFPLATPPSREFSKAYWVRCNEPSHHLNAHKNFHYHSPGNVYIFCLSFRYPQNRIEEKPKEIGLEFSINPQKLSIVISENAIFVCRLRRGKFFFPSNISARLLLQPQYFIHNLRQKFLVTVDSNSLAHRYCNNIQSNRLGFLGGVRFSHFSFYFSSSDNLHNCCLDIYWPFQRLCLVISSGRLAILPFRRNISSKLGKGGWNGRHTTTRKLDDSEADGCERRREWAVMMMNEFYVRCRPLLITRAMVWDQGALDNSYFWGGLK